MLKHKIGKWIAVCGAILLLILPGLTACRAPAPPVEEKPIKIAALYPYAIMGPGFYYSALLAAEEINETGGVLLGKVRRPIEVIKYDTNELISVTDAVTVAERAITVDKVDFLIGMMRSEAVLAVQDVAMDYKTIFIGTIGNHPDLCKRVADDYDRYKYWFRLHLPNAIYSTFLTNAITEVAADTVRKDLGIETPKVAIIAEKVIWADVVVELSKKNLSEMGMEVVGVWRPSDKASDVSPELSAIKASGAQIMQTTLTGPVRAVLSKQWNETKTPVAAVGWNVNLMDIGAWEKSRGTINYEASWNSISRTEITSKTIPYWDKFIERFGLESIGANYDAVYVLKEAIEKAGTLDADAVVVQLEKLDYEGAMGRVVFTGIESPYPHDITFGPGYLTGVGIQWIDGEINTIWPTGRATMGDKKWEGLRYEGTVDYVLPPWVVEYWKAK